MPNVLVSAGLEAIEFARIVGLELMPWQESVLLDAFTERPDGRHHFLQVAVNVPRQNGKGNVIAAMQLFGLLYGTDKLSIHTAHEYDTALSHFAKLKEWVESSDLLDRKIRRIYDANGSESIVFMNGGVLKFKARKGGGSARGFSGDRVTFDEAMIVKPGLFAAMLPILAAMPNPQVGYFGSAPLLDPLSDDWRGIIRDYRKGAERLYGIEWSSDHDVNVDDDGAMAACNPGMGVTVQAEWSRLVERPRMTDDQYARERFGAWNPDESKPSVIPKAELAECVDEDVTPGGPVAFAVEMTPAADADSRTTATIVAAGTSGECRVVEIIDHRSGQSEDWIVPELVRLCGIHDYRHVVIDGKAAAESLIPDLEAAGLRVLKLETKDVIRASKRIFDDILDGRLRYNGEPLFTSAALAVTKRDVWGSYVWSHDPKSGTTTTPFIAGALALHGLVAEPPEPATVAIGAFYV